MAVLKPSIYEFLDVIQYLKCCFQWRQSEQPKFSIASWAEELGVGSRVTLRFILRRQRSLSPRTAQVLISNLKLDDHEAQYFETLRSYSQAKSTIQREAFGKALMKLSKEKFYQKEIQANVGAKNIFGPVILTLLTFADLKKDAKTIAELLEISANEVQSILDDLESDDAIVRLADGTYFFSDNAFQIPNDVSLKKFHEFWIDRARKALELPFNVRRFRALKFALSEDDFEKLLIQINDVAMALLSRFQNDSALTGKRLYLYETILFPVSKPYSAEAKAITQLDETDLS